MPKSVPVSSAGQISPTRSAARSLWAVGTLLRATVVDSGLPGRVLLQVGRHAVEARTTLPLRSGETLNLRVNHTGELTVLQKTAPAPHTGRATGADPLRVQVADALREALPRQQSLTGLLANLQQVSSAGAAAGLAPGIVEVARAFLAQLPGYKELRRFAGLNELIALSGIAHEARAAAGRSAATPDLKGALLRLIAQLLSQSDAATGKAPATVALPATGASGVPGESAPPLRESAVQAQPRVPPSIDLRASAGTQLLHEADAVLARLQLSQLASVPVDDSGRQVWMFELALRGAHATPDLLQFRIEKEPPRQHSDEHASGTRWAVSVGLDLDELGAVEVRVSLCEQAVSTSFHAARADTRALIESRLASLRQTFTERGLKLDSVACHTGLPDKALRPRAHLIEEQE